MLVISLIVIFIAGAFFRRWWGGWQSPNHYVKLTAGFCLPLSICLINGQPLKLAVIAATLIGTGWLNPKHAFYQRYGTSLNGVSNPTMKQCILGHGLTYGLMPLLTSLLFVVAGDGNIASTAYAFAGFSAAGFYVLGWKLWPVGKKFWKLNDGYFIDAPTAIGEIGLGASVLTGLFLATL